MKSSIICKVTVKSAGPLWGSGPPCPASVPCVLNPLLFPRIVHPSIRSCVLARVHLIAFTAYEALQACSQELPGRLGITVTVNSSELPALDGWVVTPFSGCPLGEKVEKQREGIRVTLHSWAGSCRWISGKHWQGSTLGRLTTTSQSHFYQLVLLYCQWCTGGEQRGGRAGRGGRSWSQKSKLN